eukprot:349801-Chlamydomonas_euryale.AAC.62
MQRSVPKARPGPLACVADAFCIANEPVFIGASCSNTALRRAKQACHTYASKHWPQARLRDEPSLAHAHNRDACAIPFATVDCFERALGDELIELQILIPNEPLRVRARMGRRAEAGFAHCV